MKTVARETPLAELTLRKYEKPYNLHGRPLVKKFCLSVGLLQPGDSRDIIVDVLHVLLNTQKPLSSREVEELAVQERKTHSLPMKGIASSNIRRQIKRLKKLFLLERIGHHYRLMENTSLSMVFEDKIERYYVQQILERVKEYGKAIDIEFKKHNENK